MVKAPAPPIEKFREFLRYEPETGLFYWKVHRGGGKAGELAGCITEDGYRSLYFMGANYLFHRLVWAFETGEWPPEIDHKDTNRLNSLFGNLRPCSRSLNNANAKIRNDNTSGAKGVHWHASRNKYQAYIDYKGVRHRLGYFAEFETACAVRWTKAQELFGEFARVA